MASDGQQLEEVLKVSPQVTPGAQEVPSPSQEVPLELSESEEISQGPKEVL